MSNRPERIVINTEFHEDGCNTVNMALLDFEMHQWVRKGLGIFEIPTIKLSPIEAQQLIDELDHYIKAATGGDA
jgi:hypothetical protein